jgi:hypothetical protein
MTPFRHRRFIRKKKLRYPAAPQPNFTRIEKGRAESGKFVPSGAADKQARLNTHQYPQDRADYQKNPFRNVVNPTLTSHNGGMREGGITEMSKSHRVAMAQALITELAEAHQRHGDTDGTRRLQAMVARMVAELLYR